ncbi:glycosyltransferase family 4 protein [Psychroflexus sp. ALD_RP9]|uniref:glycosyltransferase family 4 protein n=1 Tax=Psychroflexus sp. ALD_RP9 TaxID=2777186 RepID=UPI001A8FD416|nr:glycosyltransferase family 4 protein [Psychroflexus sp. ALD_RP9]QSS96033.1 glycosyltransferase family 4 protein [Psychroflexus sp. ALD_RP9]
MLQKQLLIIGYVWPEPNSSAAGSRMMQLINLFLSKNFKITYASPAKTTDYTEDLTKLGVDVANIQANDSSVDQFLEALQPTHVLFDRFMMEEQFGWRVAEVIPEAIRILDTEDLHFFRRARQQAYKSKQSFKTSFLFTAEAKREIASIYRCDLSLIISQAELNLLKTQFKIDKRLLLYLPFLVDYKRLKERDLPLFQDRKDFVSIGNFLHPPNYDQVLYLKEDIWPLIKAELPQAKLHVYGAYTSQKVEQLHQASEGFLIHGRAKHAINTIKHAKVLLAPLRFGAGLKGKFIDSMRAGTPAVTTTIGAEGLCGDLPWCGEIANEAKGFAEQAVKLYQNEKRWHKTQFNGFKLLEERFRLQKFKPTVFKRLQKIEIELHKHRQANFVGQMLMHHSLQSTKYMSRWIELKSQT